jgi:hypothetical protein
MDQDCGELGLRSVRMWRAVRLLLHGKYVVKLLLELVLTGSRERAIGKECRWKSVRIVGFT